MKAGYSEYCYHKVHVLKRYIFISYCSKEVTEALRAQVWYKAQGMDIIYQLINAAYNKRFA